MSGKNAPGLRGFPTPNDMPADGGYVVFRVPKDNQWAGLILGAAQLLSYEWNFYEWGDMTPAEAADAFRRIVEQAPYETCGCNQPGGRRILRLGSTGHIEQLTDGEWTPPTDDYAVPPVPSRTEPTPEERRCAAAANAAHVLQTLYEEVADAVADGADEAEALAVMIATAITIIGGWLGLAIGALVGLALGLFFSFIEIVEFMTADLWTSDFTDALKCMLYDCSTADGDVVTFDFQCLRDAMANYTDLLDPQFITNLRLFGQVDFMLNVIGVDGLNAAGATTAITDANCADCACTVELVEQLGFGATCELVGENRWRITSGFQPGFPLPYTALPASVDEVCWCYDNYEVISGSVGYHSYNDCEGFNHDNQMPNSCCGHEQPTARSDMHYWYFASTVPFVVEFDAFCNQDC